MYSGLTVALTGAVGDVQTAVRRLVVQGVLAALIAGAVGFGYERVRLGEDDAQAAALASREVQARFAAAAGELALVAARLTDTHSLVREASRDPAASRQLFTELGRHAAQSTGGLLGLSVYDSRGVPLAWWGAVSEIPRGQLLGRDGVMASLGPLGPRLVRLDGIIDRAAPQPQRLGVVVVERLLGPDAVPDVPPRPADQTSAPAIGRPQLATSVAPVTLFPAGRAGAPAGAHVFPIRGPSGAVLLWGDVAAANLQESRTAWRSATRAAMLWILVLMFLFVAGTLMAARQRAESTSAYVGMTAGAVASLGGARLVGWGATAALVVASGPSASAVCDVPLNGLLLLGFAWTVFDAIERRRRAVRAWLPQTPRWLGWALRPVLYAAAGILGAAAAHGYQTVLGRVAADVPFDLLHFSLHPFHLQRWAFALGLVLLHAGAFWGIATLMRVALAADRACRGNRVRAVPMAGWLFGVAAFAAWSDRASGLAIAPIVIAAGLAGVAGCVIGAGRHWAERASGLGRLAALFAAVWLPAFAFYPTLHGLAVASRERVIEQQFGPQAMGLRAELQRQLEQALLAIDAQRGVPALIDGVSASPSPTAEAAFSVWSGTQLRAGRSTSAIELLNASGRIVSRFSMNLPGSELEAAPPTNCRWDVSEEPVLRGPGDRRVLRAGRAFCAGNRRLGAIVVRVMLDYRTLPFISPRSPYLASLQAGASGPAEGAPGRDVEFVSYGWSRAPLYASASRPWPLPEAVFQRLVDSRTPHWDDVVRDGLTYRVHFLGDRGGIYALGFPVVTPLGHVVSTAELTILAFAAYLLLLAGGALFHAATQHRFVSPRGLIREVRGSFYRRLFLAFVAAATVPVFVLAIATRTYFSAQLRAGIEDAASEAARVAQRLVEDYAVIEQRAGAALNLIDDEVMVLVSRAIDQDVNLFARGLLQASSERDLFASGLLSRRTSGEVYRAIAVDRLPTYVGREQVGGVDYLLAAAPVHAGGQDGIVTVPLTLRQQETERLIDEVDRRIVAASVLFVLVGAALGYWMAERIADPVSRLSRATRRIASGDLDARVAAESADEIGRLVRDFNRMAADLTRQRSELERSKRLEAWAEVARQVAHDIKNPLTPIQLAAEHARRVNLDRGEPLSPALDACVSTILGQVALLRQIASEFSSFASTPTAHPEPTALGDLVSTVIEPYRMGLIGRVDIDLSVEEGLPIVAVDRRLLSRALTNIIENALNAMSGRGTLRVDVARAQSESATGTPGDTGAGAGVRLRITDSGVGMDEEALRRIFEPYFSTKTSGTGLGLTIAKRNVELNGGTIAVQSEKGRGTTVTVTFPAPGVFPSPEATPASLP